MNSKKKSRLRNVSPTTNENEPNHLTIGEAISRVVKHRGVREGLGFDTYPTDIHNRLKEFPGEGELSLHEFGTRVDNAFSDLDTERRQRAIIQDQLKESSSGEWTDEAQRQLQDYDQRIDAKLRLVEQIQASGGGSSGESLDDLIKLYTDLKREEEAFDDAWSIITGALAKSDLSFAKSDLHDMPDNEDLAAPFHSVSLSTSIVILQTPDGLRPVEFSLLSDPFNEWIIGLRNIKGEIPGDEGKIDRAMTALRWLFEELGRHRPTKLQQEEFLKRLKCFPGDKLFAKVRERLHENYPWILKSGRTPNDRRLTLDEARLAELVQKYSNL